MREMKEVADGLWREEGTDTSGRWSVQRKPDGRGFWVEVTDCGCCGTVVLYSVKDAQELVNELDETRASLIHAIEEMGG